MSDLVAELAERSLALALEDRSRLVAMILATLHEPPAAEVAAAWDQEIERHLAAYERGEVETYAAEEVFAQARRIAPGCVPMQARLTRRAPARRRMRVRSCLQICDPAPSPAA